MRLLDAKQDAIKFAAEYAYSLANIPEDEPYVTRFKEPPSMVYEQFERAYDRWSMQQLESRK